MNKQNFSYQHNSCRSTFFPKKRNPPTEGDWHEREAKAEPSQKWDLRILHKMHTKKKTKTFNELTTLFKSALTCVLLHSHELIPLPQGWQTESREVFAFFANFKRKHEKKFPLLALLSSLFSASYAKWTTEQQQSSPLSPFFNFPFLLGGNPTHNILTMSVMYWFCCAALC